LQGVTGVQGKDRCGWQVLDRNTIFKTKALPDHSISEKRTQRKVALRDHDQEVTRDQNMIMEKKPIKRDFINWCIKVVAGDEERKGARGGGSHKGQGHRAGLFEMKPFKSTGARKIACCCPRVKKKNRAVWGEGQPRQKASRDRGG